MVLIREQADMELVGAVASACEAVEVFKQTRPDVTLMDLDLPSGSGIEAIARIRKMNASACILGLVTYEWDQAGAQARRAGAWQCVAKDGLDAEFLNLIRKRCG